MSYRSKRKDDEPIYFIQDWNIYLSVTLYTQYVDALLFDPVIHTIGGVCKIEIFPLSNLCDHNKHAYQGSTKQEGEPQARNPLRIAGR